MIKSWMGEQYIFCLTVKKFVRKEGGPVKGCKERFCGCKGVVAGVWEENEVKN